MPGPRLVAIDARSLGDPFTSNFTYWQQLLSHLPEDSQFQYVLFGSAQLAPSLAKSDPRFRYVPLRGSSRWWSLIAFPLAARRLGCACAHMQYTVSPLFRIPAVTTIHDVSYFIEPRWFSPKDAFLLRRSVPASCRRASAVIAVSQTDADELVKYARVDRTKITVAPNGLAEHFRPIPPEDAGRIVREKLRLDQPYVLLVGGIQPRKNWPLAILAVEELRRRGHPNTLLAVSGKMRDDEKAVQALIREVRGEEWVRLLGTVSDANLPALYSAASCLVHPSFHEGFGLTILEAFGTGLPVVASDRGAIPEVAGGVARLLSPNASPAEWAHALAEAMYSGDREDRIRAGLERAKLFTWKESARIVKGVYERVTKGGGSGDPT